MQLVSDTTFEPLLQCIGGMILLNSFCFAGIVRSNVVLTFFQVASRLLVLWGVIHSVPAVSIV